MTRTNVAIVVVALATVVLVPMGLAAMRPAQLEAPAIGGEPAEAPVYQCEFRVRFNPAELPALEIYFRSSGRCGPAWTHAGALAANAIAQVNP